MRVIETTTITIDASADDWQLYDKPGRDEAATALNEHLEELVNRGSTCNEVESGMMAKLNEYSDLGAIDTEGISFLELLLNKTFGKRY